MYALIELSVIGILSLISSLFNFKKLATAIGVIGLISTIALSVKEWNAGNIYYGMMRFDNYAIAFTGIICLIAILVISLVESSKEKIDFPVGETVALFLFTVIGGMVMVSFANLTMLFIGIEILSISLYVLAGSKKRDFGSNEAALKYFLMGAFATGFLLFGIALIYGLTGSFNVKVIGEYAAASKDNLPNLFSAGIFLILIGMSFKISAVPFQFWTPDVYTGAPTLVTAFMATVVKTAGIAALYRLFSGAFGPLNTVWTNTLITISALTMCIGNITAVFQTGVKRMMAYSSIAHAGYLLLAVFAFTATSPGALLTYTIGYSLATITAFLGIGIVQHYFQTDAIDNFNGLSGRNPVLAFGIAVAMFSLAGIPVTAGFFGKFYVFSTIMSQNYVWMTILAIINSCIGIYYYFKIVIAMYMKPSLTEEKIMLNPNQTFVLMVCLVLTLVLGILPNFIMGLL